jgi:hypothetical protein
MHSPHCEFAACFCLRVDGVVCQMEILSVLATFAGAGWTNEYQENGTLTGPLIFHSTSPPMSL